MPIYRVFDPSCRSGNAELGHRFQMKQPGNARRVQNADVGLRRPTSSGPVPWVRRRASEPSWSRGPCSRQTVLGAKQEFAQIAANTIELRSSTQTAVAAATSDFQGICTAFAAEVGHARQGLVGFRGVGNVGWC